MVSVQNIRELVEKFVLEQASAADFANSFTPMLSAAVKGSDQPARELAVAVHAYVSHYFHGLISVQELSSGVATVCGLDAVYPVVVSMPTPSQGYEAYSVNEQGLIPA